LQFGPFDKLCQKMNKRDNKKKGNWGEMKAAEFLKSLGYYIRETQWKSLRFEIDLIAERGDEIIFVEVKTRFSDAYGNPWEAVNFNKRKKICTSADQYIRIHQCKREPRFDIISVLHTEGITKITHLAGAFYPTL